MKCYDLWNQFIIDKCFISSVTHPWVCWPNIHSDTKFFIDFSPIPEDISGYFLADSLGYPKVAHFLTFIHQHWCCWHQWQIFHRYQWHQRYKWQVLPPVVHLDLRISPRILEKTWNDPDVIFRGLVEDDSWKKPEA